MTQQTQATGGIGWLAAIGATLAAFALACIFALAGCASPNANATLSDAIEAETAQATVTAIDGNVITVSVMEGAMPDESASTGNAPSGEPPAKPDGNTQDSSASSGITADDADVSTKSTQQEGDEAEPPAMPEGDAAPSGELPAKPDGEAPDNGAGGTPPEKPGDGEAPADMPAGGAGGTQMTLTVSDESIIFSDADGAETPATLADIAEGAHLQLSVENGTDVTKIVVSTGASGSNGAPGAPGNGSGSMNNGSGATTLSTDTQTSGESYAATDSDQNALRVEAGATAGIADATITKTGDSSSSEDSDFYGLNAAVLAYDGAKLTLSNGTVTTDSSGSNGVFSYGEGTEVTVSDTIIRCSQGNSGGIEVAGGATLTATDLDIDTQGESSAAIRSDRGGGTETVTGGTYVTHGKHSPAVYSTADVTVNDATLTAENCEGIVIEGKNSVKLVDCDVTGNVNGVATRTDVVNNVMIYQSMSGDASEGTGSFTMSGGSFDAAHGTVFYVTNTDATIDLEGVDIANADGQLLVVAGNDGQWGTSGKNGGTVKFTATEQALSGGITVDTISSLDLALGDETVYEGSINADGAAGTVNVTLADGARWTLDGDSYISSLSGDTSGIDLNGHTLYVDGNAWSA